MRRRRPGKASGRLSTDKITICFQRYVVVMCPTITSMAKKEQDESPAFHGWVGGLDAISAFLTRMPSRSTLFVSNLPYTATSTDLKTLFSDIAPVRSAFVVLEHGTGVSKGVGYVSFAITEDAKAAFHHISVDGMVLDGRNLRAEWAANKVSFGATSFNE